MKIQLGNAILAVVSLSLIAVGMLLVAPRYTPLVIGGLLWFDLFAWGIRHERTRIAVRSNDGKL